MKPTKQELLSAYQWDMVYISSDDMPLASVLSLFEARYGRYSKVRWQLALDFIHRLVKSGLAVVDDMPESGEVQDEFFFLLASNSPFELDPGYWLELQMCGTEKCSRLIDAHHVGWESPPSPSYASALEEIFAASGVGMGEETFFEITFPCSNDSSTGN